ncbi:MAG TPA: EF-P beta-lysylation protein EpmB [Steroidobacteraceae bacterium]|jgi:EF-P beta-lysylation protein EpmB|nr:EF-P beta-lysylation protein EpmB [Steroidobacteraceae bacterium]
MSSSVDYNQIRNVPISWQRELQEAVTDPRELLAVLGLPASMAQAAERAGGKFSLRVTRSFLSRMRPGDARDPLLRQVLPVDEELLEVAGYGADPLEEGAARRAPQLLHKYTGRALLIATEACAIHCRYCFRREFPYSMPETRIGPRWGEALGILAQDSSIEEVILSGGDPLSLGDARLTQLTDALAKLPHLKRLRVHTRQPIVLPSRVDAGLITWLRGIRLPTIMVLHSNHPNEIDADVRAACAALRAAGVTLLNQAVLLRGVNDDAGTLERLSVTLMDAGVLPYYLHVPDRVRGTAHFDVDDHTARGLIEQLMGRLSGYLVPRLVREVPGATSKMPLPIRS